MKKRLVITGLSACLAMLLFAPVTIAQTKTVIKLGWTSSDGAQDPYAIGARAYKAALEAASKGSIEVQLYPNRQLGDEKPMLEGLRFGTVDAAIITNAVVAQIETAFQLNDLPFLYSNEAQAHKVLDGKIGAELAKKLDSKGIVLLGYMEGGFRNMINNKKPVQQPSDVTGVKYRVMQNPVFIDMFNSLGGSAVPMAWGETFTAVQQGTIDGLEIPLAVIDASKYYEVTKFLSLTNHTYSAIPLLMSKRTLDKLTPDQRKAVFETAKLAVSEQRKTAADNAKHLLTALQSKGMKVNNISDAAAFRKSVAPMYEKFRTSIGADLLASTLELVK
ncbi:MAG: TRAP transporter substrate-binding protein [Burkholderiaceae bacterium]